MGIRTSEQCIALDRHVGLPPHVRGPYNEEGQCNYIIHLRDGTQEGPMIGMFKLLQPQEDTPPQIGWVYSGKGYATEAAGEALRY
jgi:RimJ/RimL family protein N-acetyltransferase